MVQQLTYPPMEFNFNWLDCGNPAAEDGSHIFSWKNNTGYPVCFERFEVINGTTAGTVTAGVVTLSTTDTDYVATMPGGTTITALGTGYVQSFADDVINPDDTISVTITTAPTTAKEAKGRIILRPAGY